MGTAVHKAVGMILCMPGWHVSLRLSPPSPLAVVECIVRIILSQHSKHIKVFKGQLLAMSRGQVVDKNIKPEEAGGDAPAATQDAKDNKEDKLPPFPAAPVVPAPKLLPFPKRPAAQDSESSSSRAPSAAAAQVDPQLEMDRQTRSVAAREKKQKETKDKKTAEEEKPAKKTKKAKPAAQKRKFAFLESESDSD